MRRARCPAALKYAGDMIMPGMLHVQVLRSPHAHARIVSIDTSAALAMDGVEGVITCGRRAGRGRFRRFRARSADHGARQGALCRRGSRRGRRRGCAHRQARGGGDQGRLRATAAGVRSGRGDAAGRAGGARLCAGQHHQAHSDPRRRCRGRLRRSPISSSRRTIRRRRSSTPISSRKRGSAYVDHDGVVTVVSPSQNITHHRHMLAKHHRQADQQGALHHVAGRRRLRRQGRHDLPGHAGACWR